MALSKVQIQSHGPDPTVTIDGVEVPAVTGFHATIDPETRVPVVALNVPAEVDIDIEGVVRLIREPTDLEVHAVAAAALRDIDIEGLREMVKGRLRTMRDDPIAKTLEVIAELVGEVQDDG